MPTVALASEWGIEASEVLKTALEPHLEADDDVVVVIADAGRVHSATVQLLAAFVRTRRDAGRATRITACAETLHNAAIALGLATEIGLALSSSSERNAL